MSSPPPPGSGAPKPGSLSMPPPPSGPVAVAAPVIAIPTPKAQPPKAVFYTPPGFGKTCTAAYAQNPLIICMSDDQGYHTLLGQGLVPAIPESTVDEWQQLLALVDLLVNCNDHYDNIFFDGLSGIERMCHQFVCDTEFKGVWGERGFGSFKRGYEASTPHLTDLCARLDRLHRRGMGVWILAHARVKKFPNPQGEDFDQYEVDCHPKTWAPFWKWSNAVLFGVVSRTADEDGKAKGGKQRVVYTSPGAAHIAKNQFGMADIIDLPMNPAANFATINKAMRNS